MSANSKVQRYEAFQQKS